MTVRTDAIFHNRRLMQTEAAGIAMLAAARIRVPALVVWVYVFHRRALRNTRTDVAPNRCPVFSIAIPHHSIDEKCQTSQRCPNHV